MQRAAWHLAEVPQHMDFAVWNIAVDLDARNNAQVGVVIRGDSRRDLNGTSNAHVLSGSNKAARILVRFLEMVDTRTLSRLAATRRTNPNRERRHK